MAIASRSEKLGAGAVGAGGASGAELQMIIRAEATIRNTPAASAIGRILMGQIYISQGNLVARIKLDETAWICHHYFGISLVRPLKSLCLCKHCGDSHVLALGRSGGFFFSLAVMVAIVVRRQIANAKSITIFEDS